jgi:hypothetical protein
MFFPRLFSLLSTDRARSYVEQQAVGLADLPLTDPSFQDSFMELMLDTLEDNDIWRQVPKEAQKLVYQCLHPCTGARPTAGRSSSLGFS